ncbi:MAG TPA: hypothetical protein VIL28_15730 [Steroidobacteraceae bacterium]
MANDPEDPKRDPSKDSADTARPPEERKRTGRVTFDSRGNSIWEWQLETGVYTRDVSTQKLKKLDLGDLSIAETAIQPSPLAGKIPGGRTSPEGGFNPYDKGSPSGGFNPYDNARATGKRLKDEAAPQRARTPADLRKLDEWIKLKKKLEAQKKGEDDK